MVAAPTPSYPDIPLEREFIGYGMDTPDPKWPGQSNIALSFQILFYAGAERSIASGDDGAEPFLIDIPARTALLGKRNDSSESMYEYGAREGVPRLLRLFEKYKMTPTWNVNTDAMKLSPGAAKKIVESGTEISCAGKRFIDYLHVKPEVEAEHIAEAIATLQEVTGDKTLPHGWMVDRCSSLSTLLYAKEHEKLGLPLVYASDSTSDELPYWVPSPTSDLAPDGVDQGLLIIPSDKATSDSKFNDVGSGWASPKDYYEYLVDTFDLLYSEGEAGEAKMMSVVLHPHIIGHGGRIYYLEKFLKYVSEKEKVWVARRDEIAAHWAALYPYDPKKAFGQTKNVACW